MRILKLLCAAALLYSAHGASQIASGAGLITAMKEKYDGGKWYRDFTFSQNTVFYDNSGLKEKEDVWHEASSAPGKLLIRYHRKDSPDGVIFNAGKVHVFKDNKLTHSRPMVHDLSLVGFDVYFLDPSVTCRLLDSLGYRLDIVRRDTFEGHPVYVLGATANDTLSNQIWIDADGLFMRRMIYKQGKALQEVVFTDYRKMKAPGKKLDYLVATRVIFYINGRLRLQEHYFDIRFPKRLDPALFDPGKYAQSKLN